MTTHGAGEAPDTMVVVGGQSGGGSTPLEDPAAKLLCDCVADIHRSPGPVRAVRRMPRHPLVLRARHPRVLVRARPLRRLSLPERVRGRSRATPRCAIYGLYAARLL